MANSVDPDQTAPIGHFQMHLFLGPLRVNRIPIDHDSAFGTYKP